MLSDNLEDLLQELQELTIQLESVTRRIISARNIETSATSTLNTPLPEVPASIIPEDVNIEDNTIDVNKRIEITNTIRKFGFQSTPKDRIATVTKVTKTRVYFTTDSGISTYRAHHNVRLI